MRTNFWIGVAQVVLLLFAAAIVLLAAQRLTSPANYYRLAALAAVATIGGPVSTNSVPQAQPPLPAYSPPLQQPPASSTASYTARSASTVIYNITVSNNKANSDTYHVTLRSSAGWAAADSLPSTLTLGPNSSAQFSVTVRVPANANGESDETSVIVSSDLNGEQESSTLTTVVCNGCNP